MLGLELVQQQRLREARDDRCRVVDLVGDAAHQLAQGGQLFRLLVLRLGASLVGDVARENQHAGDGAPLPHRCVQQRRNAVAPVGADQRDLQALHVAPERCGEPLLDEGDGVGVHEVEQGGPLRGPGDGSHAPRRLVRLEDPAGAVDHDDGVGDGVHDEPQVAFRGRCRRERIHERSGLARDLVLEQRRVAAVGAQRMREPDADDGHRHADQHRGTGVGLGRQGLGHRDGGDAGQSDDDRRDARDMIGDHRRGPVDGSGPPRRQGGGAGKQQEGRVPPEIERASGPEGAAERGDRIRDVRGAQDDEAGDHDAGGRERDRTVAEQFDEDEPQHRDAAHRPPDTGEQREERAAGLEQGFQQERVRQRPRRERDQGRVEQQLHVEQPRARSAQQARESNEEADVDPQKADVRERRVGGREAAQLVPVPPELAAEKQRAPGADPRPRPAAFGVGVAARRHTRTDERVQGRPGPRHIGDARPRRAIGRGEQVGQHDRQERDGGDRHQDAGEPGEGEGGHARPPG